VKPTRRTTRFAQAVLALVAVGFGLATVMAGGRVLAGVDPGYVVFRPLLFFNTTMGLVYLAAGVVAWRNLDTGRSMAAIIFLLNLLVLGIIGVLYREGEAVAPDSLRAMTFRTVIWLGLFVGLAWIGRRGGAEKVGPNSGA